MTSPQHIRPGSENEAELLAKIHQECFPTGWNKKEFTDMLAIAGTQAWLAGNDGMMLCRMLHDQAEILTLAVCPAARRRGLAAALLEKALRAAEKQGVKRMFLEVSADNEAACALYTKAGFALINRRKAYYRQPDNSSTDALVLAKELA